MSRIQWWRKNGLTSRRIAQWTVMMTKPWTESKTAKRTWRRQQNVSLLIMTHYIIIVVPKNVKQLHLFKVFLLFSMVSSHNTYYTECHTGYIWSHINIWYHSLEFQCIKSHRFIVFITFLRAVYSANLSITAMTVAISDFFVHLGKPKSLKVCCVTMATRDLSCHYRSYLWYYCKVNLGSWYGDFIHLCLFSPCFHTFTNGI